MPLISLHLVCNYHRSTVNGVVNDHIRKCLVSPFQGSKRYLVMALAFVFRITEIQRWENLQLLFYSKGKRVCFIINLCPVFHDTSAKCHTFIYHLHWLSVIHIFLLSSSPFHKIITMGMPLNASNWSIHFKFASLSIQWVNIVLSFQT